MKDTNHGQTETAYGALSIPHEIVGDPALSKGQKKEALDVLEQDARQLSVAADEGMTGGESSGLHEVLDAKSSLELAPTAYAYAVVLKDLRSRLQAGVTGEARAIVERAVVDLDAIVRSEHDGAGTAP